jgi:hypothetical protein
MALVTHLSRNGIRTGCSRVAGEKGKSARELGGVLRRKRNALTVSIRSL